MPHSKQTILVLTFAALLSASALSVTLARPAPPTKEQVQVAQQKLALEAQLADMQMKYSDSNPRVVALREQIAYYASLTTPQAEATVGGKARPRRLQRLLAQRSALRLQLSDAQLKYTNANPRVRNLQEQLSQLEAQIAEVQRKRH